MFFNYKYKNTKSIYIFFTFNFFTCRIILQNRPQGFSVKKMGGKGKGPGVEVDSFFKLYPNSPDIFHSDHYLVSVLITDVKFSKNSL